MVNDKYNGKGLVFIVGSPRSGTTWLQRLLASHPKIFTGQESGIFDSYIGPQIRAWHRDLDTTTSGRGGVGVGCYHTGDEFFAHLHDYMMTLMEPMVGNLKEGELFIEKTPSHALFLKEIMEMLPESRVIHIIRDPRDVVASLIAASKSWGSFWAPNDVVRAASMWLNHVRAVRRSSEVIPEGQFMELYYEELLKEPFSGLKPVLSFVDVEWSDDGIREAIEDNKASKARLTGGTEISVKGEFAKEGKGIVEPEGFVRTAKSGGWREELSLKDKVRLWSVLKVEMREYGYEWRFPFS